MKYWMIVILFLMLFNVTIAETPGRAFKSLPHLEFTVKMTPGAPENVDEKSLQGLIELSKDYEEKKQYDKGINTLLKVLRSDKNNYIANLRLGWLYYLNKQYSTANKYYRRANNIYSKENTARLGIVNSLIASSQWTKALQYSRKYRREYNNEKIWNLKIAYIYYSNNKFREAIKHYELVYDYYKDNEEIRKAYSQSHNALAWKYFNNKSYDTAMKQYKRAYIIDETNITAINGILYSAIKLNRFTEALKYITILKKSGAIDKNNVSTVAYTYFENKRYNEAALYYREALKYDPSNKVLKEGLCWSYIYIGLQKIKEKDYSDAIRYYKSSYMKCKDNKKVGITCLKGIRDSYIGLNKYDKAINIIKRIDSVDSSDIENIITFAYLYYKQKNYIKAKENYMRVLQINSENQTAKDGLMWCHIEIAWSHFQNRQYDKSIEHYQAAYNINSKSKDALWGLILSLTKSNKYKEALKRSIEYEKKNKGDVTFYNNTAFLFYNAKKYPEARKYYSKTLKSNAEDVKANLGMGWTLYNLENCILAKKHFEKVLDKDKDNASAKQGLLLCDRISKNQATDIEIRPHYSYFSFSDNTVTDNGYQVGLFITFRLMKELYLKLGYTYGIYETVFTGTNSSENILYSKIDVFPDDNIMTGIGYVHVLTNDEFTETGDIIYLKGQYLFDASIVKSIGLEFAYSTYPIGNTLQISSELNTDISFLRSFTRLSVYDYKANKNFIIEYAYLNIPEYLRDLPQYQISMENKKYLSVEEYLSFDLTDWLTFTIGGWIGHKVFSVDANGEVVYNTANTINSGFLTEVAIKPYESFMIMPYIKYYGAKSVTNDSYSAIVLGSYAMMMF